MSMTQQDYEELTRPGGLVPVDVKTTAKLVQEVVRLRAALHEIGYLDAFMDADSAAEMMGIARKALANAHG